MVGLVLEREGWVVTIQQLTLSLGKLKYCKISIILVILCKNYFVFIWDTSQVEVKWDKNFPYRVINAHFLGQPGINRTECCASLDLPKPMHGHVFILLNTMT